MVAALPALPLITLLDYEICEKLFSWKHAVIMFWSIKIHVLSHGQSLKKSMTNWTFPTFKSSRTFRTIRILQISTGLPDLLEVQTSRSFIPPEFFRPPGLIEPFEPPGTPGPKIQSIFCYIIRISNRGEFLGHMYKAFRKHLRIRDLNLHNN